MRHRRKILYVITKSVWGGAQKYVYDLTTNLPPDQFETTVVTGGCGQLTEKLSKAGVKTIILPTLQGSNNFFKVLLTPVNLRALLALISIYRKARPDVIHLNSSKIGGLGALAAFLHKLLTLNFKYLNIVFTVHGWGFKEDRPLWQKAAIFFFSWLSSLFQDKIILINTVDCRTAQRFIPQRKLALIPNGMTPIDFLPRKEARAFFTKKIERPITDDTILIGTNAELTRNKGLEYLIAALSKLLRSDLNSNYRGPTSIVIGEGSSRKQLEDYISSSGLTGKIFLTGFIPDAERYLKGFDVFVLPSLKEGLPYTILEAMAAGLPVVATDVGGIPDLVKNRETGFLVPPRDPNALAEALKSVMEDKNLRSRFSTASLQIMKTKFHLSQMIRETTALYV